MESVRLLTRLYGYLRRSWQPVASIALLILGVVLLTTLITLIVLVPYYRLILGYSPNFSETQPFLILYLGLSITILTIYLSNHFIQRSLNEQLRTEQRLHEEAEEHFARFTRGINPDLLMECLEAVISTMRQDVDQADDLIDDMSELYRYTLRQSHEKVVTIQEELDALSAFTRLINRLPFRKIELHENVSDQVSIIPGTLLTIVEVIVRSTIVRRDVPLVIWLDQKDHALILSYDSQDRLRRTFDRSVIARLSDSYLIYTNTPIRTEASHGRRTITIPFLQYQDDAYENSNH